ncbi:Phospholipase/carboxylesterase [Pilatotrama ljubarskyi]|nr:Phospholipase/carboxylesterase [Pilatotrama ljubarskyi]
MATAGGNATGTAPLVIPPKTEHAATVVFVHGLGQRNESWVTLLEPVVARLPGVKWIIPQAPSAPVAFNNGHIRPSWFNIANLPPTCYDEAGVAASVATIENLVISEVRGGVESAKIVLVGFSQGAALSLMTALTTLHELGGVASLSGWIPKQSRQAMLQIEPVLPVFWGHGTADTEVPLLYAEECVSFLRESLNIPEDRVVFKKYEGLEHTVNDAELGDLTVWLSEILA